MFVARKCSSNPQFTLKIFAFQKKKKNCLPTYSNFEFEKMGTKKFFYHGLTESNKQNNNLEISI